MSYNGWRNYETWAYALWMDNDQGSYNWARQLAADALYGADDDKDAAARDLADKLKDEAEEAMPELEASVWSDLLRAAMSEINWHEIAENLITEMKE